VDNRGEVFAVFMFMIMEASLFAEQQSKATKGQRTEKQEYFIKINLARSSHISVRRNIFSGMT